MKVLLDSCIAGVVAPVLRQAGHDVVYAGEWDTDPGDDDILSTAADEGRVLITIDKDFGELAVVQGWAHAGMIRLVGFRAAEQGDAAARLLQHYAEELATAAIITAEPWRVRIRVVEQ